MLRLLVRDCQFYLQLALFPAVIMFRVPSKQMFGQLRQTLSDAMEFPEKKQLLSRADRLNNLRIDIVHGLTKRRSSEWAPETSQAGKTSARPVLYIVRKCSRQLPGQFQGLSERHV